MIVNSISANNYNPQRTNNNITHNNHKQNYLRKVTDFQKDTGSFGERDFNIARLGEVSKITPQMEREFAEYLIDEKEWKTVAGIGYALYFYNKYNFGERMFINPEKEMKAFVTRIGYLRAEIINEEIQDKENQIKENEVIKTDEKIIIGGKRAINTQYFNKVNNNFSKIPTAIMIHSGKETNRNGIIKWFKNQTLQQPKYSVVEFNHENEDKTLYRLETEINYAENR